MAESPHPPAERRPRRWGRRIATGLGGAVLLLAALAAVSWTWRVSLLNRFLADDSSVWRVRVDGLDWSGPGLEATGLQVFHTDQAEPVFTAARATSSAGWSRLKQGQLGALRIESPRVYWRPGLRSDPPNPTNIKGVVPMATWDSLQLSNGRIDVAIPGQFSFAGSVSGQGGAGAWQREGRLSLAPQNLVFTAPEYQMTMTGGGPINSVQVAAREISLQASVDAGTGMLAISTPLVTGTRLQLNKPPGSPVPSISPAPAANDKSGTKDAGPAVVSGVAVSGLKAPALEFGSVLPWALGGRADFSLDSLTAGTGIPFSMSGAKLDQASATLPENAGLPLFSLDVSYQAGQPRLDSLTLAGATIPDLAALLRQWGIAGDNLPSASFKADAVLSGLALEDGVPMSTAKQTLTLTDLKLDLPGQGKGSAKRLTVNAIPDEITAVRRLRLVELTSPEADLILLSTFAGLTQTAAPTDGAVPSATEAAVPRPAWEGWTADVLTLTDGIIAATLPQAGNARVTTGLTISTVPAPLQAEGAPDSHAAASSPDPAAAVYQVTLAKPQLVHPEFPTQPIALATAIQLTATAAGLWLKREIESLTLAGSQLQIGEAIFRLVKALPPSPPAQEPPATSQLSPPFTPAPPWRRSRLVIEDTLVQLDHLGDGRRLDIPIKRQEFRNLPLDTTALATVDRLYKIEVPNITLYNPWVEGQKAAVLDTNYIQFTPSGLLSRRLERVDLMLPSLYAGEALFDFVDATRQHFEKIASAKPGLSPDAPLLVDNTAGSPTVLSALASVTPSTVATATADWHIPFYTESGKVYVAPKGFPWPNLPVIPFRNARDPKGKPIPFLLRGETFHGELAVEPGWYDFPEYKLRLRLSDRGRIIFNTPQKDRDNNLTEVFENNTLIFRQLRIDKVWLSITYDANGIYAKFGGHTCGGTISGAFNLYLDELYTWDAWASMVAINMQPLTDKLTPDTFRMTGPVDELTVKAYGDTTTLYQAILQLSVSKPGLLHILALDSMKQELASIGGLSGDLGKIGLDTVRDFSYTGCTGSLKLFGTEGTGNLHLTGPAGSRTFNLRLHDYRAKTPKSMAPF